MLKSNLLLAPMAGYTDAAFRRLARDYGAALTVTEMISAKGLVYKNAKTRLLLKTAENESPACVQLFGREPDIFAAAVKSDALADFNIIDINMGCPMPKITKNGEGSALLNDVKTAAAVVSAAVKAAGTRPVTVKLRIGFNNADFDAASFAKALEGAGAAAITVHGRTAAQLYSGRADWEKIAEVARAVKIPVIGNGDVKSCEEARERIKESCVAGAAIGRGALADLSVFGSGAGTVGASIASPKPSALLKETVFKHLKYMEEYFSPRYCLLNFRKFIPYYFKGAGARDIKRRLIAAASIKELKEELLKCFI